MGNAIEDALNRASPEQQARNRQVIEEARRNIKLVSMQQMEDISPSGADAVARNAQVIEEAKRNIPFETMHDVESISPQLPTPSDRAHYNSRVVDLHPHAQATIEHIEQGEGNNYLRQNAVDRAMERQPQVQEHEQQQRQGISR